MIFSGRNIFLTKVLTMLNYGLVFFVQDLSNTSLLANTRNNSNISKIFYILFHAVLQANAIFRNFSSCILEQLVLIIQIYITATTHCKLADGNVHIYFNRKIPSRHSKSLHSDCVICGAERHFHGTVAMSCIEDVILC